MAPRAPNPSEALKLAKSAANDGGELVVARVRLLAAMRAAWLHDLWSREAGDGETPLSRIATDRDRPAAEAEWRVAADELADLRAALGRIEAQLRARDGERFDLLGEIFGLDRSAIDLMHVTLAYQLDEGLAAILRHLSGEGGPSHPTSRLAARLFGADGPPAWRSDSPLARWRIVTGEDGDPVNAPLTLDPAIRDWLVGGPLADPRLAGLLRAVPRLEPLDHWPVAATAEHLERMFGAGRRVAARVAVIGVEGVGRQSFAAAVAHRLGLAVVAADVTGLGEARREEVVVRVHRHAFIARAAIIWRGCGAQPPALPADLTPFPIEFHLLEPHEAAPPQRGRADLTVSLEPPEAQGREQLWRRHCAAAATWPADALRRLASGHRAAPGRIATVAALQPRSVEEAGAALRMLDRHRFGRLAEHLSCPFGQEDLILPARLAEQLATLQHEAISRAAFWERPGARRLFAQGRGLVALFTGPPGTGKTMAAQVLARALGLDLYRVDLSTVVSKYVGETAANIERILAEARATDVVLLFDEADGLFARRTDVSDAHDRYANTDTGHLLQAIERHDGIVLLASNRKRNIDEAFLRRLRYVLEFPLPEDGARLTIWRQVLAELAGAEAAASLQPALGRIAGRIVMTGAQIKHAALTAIFHAERAGEPIGRSHILRGIDAELMKEGRALSERELKQLEVEP